MKNCYLFILLLLGLGTIPAQAQLSGSDSLQAKLSSIFVNVDKTQVPSGYLYEAGVRLLEPRFYNGLLTDSNRTDMDVLRYLRLQLRSAYVASSEPLPALPAYNTRLDAAMAAGGGAIPISVQFMQYNTIRPDAIQNNLLRVRNEQLFDVAGRAQNPYRSQLLFAAAPVRSLSPTNTVSFVLPRNLYLTNSNVSTYAPQVDFGDGRGYQQAAWDQPLGTIYATAGLKRVKVKLSFASSYGPQESWFDFNVLGGMTATAAAKGNAPLSTATCTICDDERPVAPVSGTHSGGTVYIIYGNNSGAKHTQLIKPFIISEGYNLYDIAPELRKCNNPNNSIEDFFNNINRDFFDANGNKTGNFRTNLLNAGYDIVYIDNAKGTDDIVRNAQFFEAVVRSINLMKLGGTTSGQQNVVMGQSMGGLVSRYGLAEMTKRGNDDPHTRLLILHDSPQRGAYNPVGVQSLGRSFDVPFLFGNTLGDLNGQLRATVRVLNQPATQQLSILNALNGRGNIQPNTFIPNTYQPMITFTGRPPYDVVAVSNGSQCGRPQNTPVGVAISQSALAVLLPLPYVGLAGITGNFASYGLPAYGQQATVSRISLRLEYQIRIGYCPFCVTIPIRFNLLRESAQSPANTLPYETLPGGSANPVQQAGSCADGFDFGSLNGIYAAYFRTNLYNGDICFVPSYSALDVPTVTPTTAFAKYVNSTTDNPSKPNLNQYIAQENVNSSGTQFNVAHISFTPRNSEWIFDQMQNLPLSSNICSTECLTFAPTISGPDAFCLNSSSANQYTITNLPAGVSVAWSATTTAGTVSPASYTGPTYTLSASSATAGTVTVQAVLSSATCTLATLQLSVALGSKLNYTINTSSCAPTITVIAPGYLNVTLTVNGDQVSVGNGTQYQAPWQNRQLDVNLTGTDKCTNQSLTRARIYTEARGQNCAERTTQTTRLEQVTVAKAYPNPADEYVELTQLAASAGPEARTSAGIEVVRLYDTYGQLRLEQVVRGTQAVRLRVSQLPPGFYVLHVVQQGIVVSRQSLQLAR